MLRAEYAAMSRGECQICHGDTPRAAQALGVCADCVRTRFTDARPHIEQAHAESRAAFGLPTRPPRTEGGVRCNLCVNEC